MPDNVAEQAIAVYRTLAADPGPAGDQDLPSFRPDHWDLRVEGILVELDEERHFNRYRARTLRSPVYERLTAFPLTAYRAFCVQHESACLASASYGGYWSNKSCEAMFGKASKPRDLAGAGAPRWKQRAFYDYLKDLAPLCGHGPMVRLAVWDELPGVDQLTLGGALEAQRRERSVATSVISLIHARARS